MLTIINTQFQNTSSMQQLAGGLRINGQAPSSAVEAAPSAVEEVQPENNQEAAAASEVSEAASIKSISDRFADTLLGRLINDKTSFASLEEAQSLVESVENTVKEVKDQFGNQTATQVMADILTNTDVRLDADSIAMAVGGALQSLQRANQSVLEKGDATEEEFTQAKDMQKKLKTMPEFLNAEDKDPGKTSGESAVPQSLSSALNTYFRLKGEEQKLFTEEFAWKTEASIEEEKRRNSDYFTITVAEFGQENIAQLVNFLEDYLQDEGAADIIKKLSGDDDIFEAVEKVRDYFYAEVGAQHSSGISIQENSGLNKLSKFNTYLDKYMNRQVNDVIANNADIKNRMLHYAKGKFGSLENVPDNLSVSFSTYIIPEPEPYLRGGLDPNTTYRGRNGNPVVQFLQNQSTSLEDYKQNEIEMVKAWADFNRLLADTDPEGLGKSGLAAADSLMKQYEEMKNAFETNTPSTYKTLSEQMLDGYTPFKRTQPGCLVDTVS